jgi:tetratricopeptide (TPR) repeat protein
MQNNPKDVFYLMRLASYYGGTQRPAEMAAMLQNVLSRPQDFPDGPADVGDFYFRVGQLDQALKNYQQGVQSDPKNKARYQKRVIEVLVQQGKVAEASQLVEAILKENPKDIEATAIRASLALDSANPEQVNRSIAELQGAINGMPQNPVLRFNLGRAYLAKGDLDQAKIQFQDAIKVRPDYLPARLALGQLLLLRGDYTGALNMANETLELARNSTVALLVRAGALTGLGNLDQARKELTEIVKRFPQSRDARMQLGVLDLQEKKFKDAEAVFERLRAEAPLDPRGVLLLSRTYMAENRGQDAVKLLQGELAKNPDRGDLRLALAGVAMSLNNGEMAIKELTTLLEKNPKDAGLQLRMGDAYRLAGDSKQALSYFQKARELAPNDPGANLYYALMLEANGQGATARPIYEQILKLAPDNVIALNNLAFLMAESGSDLDQALTLATRAKQRVPSDMNIADTLGWIYIKKNLSDDAIKIFRDLVQKNPTHVTWRYHLAMALYQKGDKVQARKELEICLKNRPKKDEEAKIKDLMDKVG